MSEAARIQSGYYERTAQHYDAMHVSRDDEHHLALEYIWSLIGSLHVSSMLDVGCGTGRGLRFFLNKNPEIMLRGVEPVEAMILQATTRNFISPGLITRGFGESLPFSDRSFDVSYECGVLHHARDPGRVVREMMRVSRKAIFLSDENRFAHGNTCSRWAKLLLCKMGLFRWAYKIKTLGKGYRYSEGDGLAYSYSVFDCFELLSSWADRIILIPTDNVKPTSIFHPLVTSFHVLLCAIRDRTPDRQERRN